jgi:hypothetical protein
MKLDKGNGLEYHIFYGSLKNDLLRRKISKFLDYHGAILLFTTIEMLA